MGETNSKPTSQLSTQNQKQNNYEISRHTYNDLHLLANPYNYVYRIKYQQKEGRCCNLTSLYIHTRPIELTLEHLFVIKRKNKQSFSEQEIWYTLKYISSVLGYLEDRELTYGIISPSNFILDSGRYLRINVKHLRPCNQHFKDYNIANYYSPEYIQCMKKDIFDSLNSIDKYKSQVFAVGLLIIQMCLIPQHKPKHYSIPRKEIIWINLAKSLQLTKSLYSQALNLIIGKMIAQDLRNRADWKYINSWIFRNNQRKFSISPCIFGVY